jgi:hypothetical protein
VLLQNSFQFVNLVEVIERECTASEANSREITASSAAPVGSLFVLRLAGTSGAGGAHAVISNCSGFPKIRITSVEPLLYSISQHNPFREGITMVIDARRSQFQRSRRLTWIRWPTYRTAIRRCCVGYSSSNQSVTFRPGATFV